MASKKAPKNSPATSQRADSPYAIKRNVTMPTLKLALETAVYVKITGPMFQGRPQPAKPGEEPQKPATVVPIVNVETGEAMQLVLGAALASTLAESYPEDSYVEKGFRIVKHDKRPGKRYFTYSVDEIELPE